MKITYLHQYFNTPSMWGSHRSYEMARRLVNQGHEVKVITAYTKNDIQKSFDTNIDGIDVHWIPVPYSNHLSFGKRIWAFVKFSFLAIPSTLKHKSDLIFATSTPLTISIPAIICKIITRRKFVFEVRDLWPELPIAMNAIRNPIAIALAKVLERISYYFADAVIALSPGMKEGVVKAGKMPSSVAVIPNLCDFNLKKDDAPKITTVIKNIDNNKPIIAFTGAFGLINNIEWIVDLGYELDKINSNVQILLIGDGKTKDKVKQKIDKLKLNNRVKIIKPFPKKDMPVILNNITMSVITFNDIPEMRNNSANKFFDALATGRPIIINFGGWINKLITENNCGIDGWRIALLELAIEVDSKCNDTMWLEYASKNSFELGKKYFDRDMAAINLGKIFNEVLNGRNKVSHLVEEDYCLK